jgi:hypothetical protein
MLSPVPSEIASVSSNKTALPVISTLGKHSELEQNVERTAL